MPKGNSGLGSSYDSDRSIGWDFGSVSEGGGCGDGPLSVDDGSVHQRDGAVSSDHAVGQRQYNKSSGFSQPSDRDFGPDFTGASHIDDGQVTPEWAGVEKMRSSDKSWTDQPLNASTSRVRRVSSDEYFPDSPYSYPAKRGGDDPWRGEHTDTDGTTRRMPTMNAHLDGAERPKRGK